jgi:hypothetical protein
VCGMNLALGRAATDRIGDNLIPRLDPVDGRCCVLVEASVE